MTAVHRRRLLRWVEALESGKYRQGRGELHNEVNNTYCVYGVGLKVARIKPTNRHRPPCEFFQWCGYHVTLPLVRLGRRDWTLMGANDAGKTFTEIAAAMRKKWGL